MHFIRFKGNEVFMESQLCKLFDLSMDELNSILHSNNGIFEEGQHYFKLEGEELRQFNEEVVHDILSSTIYVWSLDAIPLLTRVIRSQPDKVYSNKKSIKDNNTSDLNSKTIEVNGETYHYKSYRELCKKVGVSNSTFLNRRKRGMSLEDALYNGSLVNLKPVIFKGDYFESKAELCRRYNVRYKRFLARQSAGYTLKECVFGKDKEIVRNPNPDREIAEAHGISVFALYRKMHIEKLTLEEAIKAIREEDDLNKTDNVKKTLTEKKRKKDMIEEVIFNGKKYTSARELSADCGVAASTLKVHLKRGLSVEEIQDKVKEAKMKKGKM